MRSPGKQSAFRRRYVRALEAHRKSVLAGTGETWLPAFRFFVTFAARLLAAKNGVRFPARAVKDWYWTWRWRFEFLMGWLEEESVELAAEWIRPGTLVIDGGAHIGYYTRLFSRMAGKDGLVWAFEPETENFGLLAGNVAGRSNVRLFEAALGGNEQEALLHLSPGSTNHCLMPGYTANPGTLPIHIHALDAMDVPEYRAIFVKLDVEGSELAALRGMARTLHVFTEVFLLVECNPEALRVFGATPADLLDELGRYGLEVWTIGGAGLAPVDLGAVEGVSNWFCKKPLTGRLFSDFTG